MTTALNNQYKLVTTKASPGPNLPQRVGERLWAPMFVMSLMGFGVGFILALSRSNAIASGSDAANVAALGHFTTAAMFVGFASVFSAISFAIARILGAFRTGGGDVQAAVGNEVATLEMPKTAKAFIVVMAMGMMLIVAGVIGHLVIGGQIAGGSATALASSEQWAIALEAVRRLGVATYLVSIALGLSTIVTVLSFQTLRISELAGR